MVLKNRYIGFAALIFSCKASSSHWHTVGRYWTTQNAQYAEIGVQNSKTTISRMVLNYLTFLYSKFLKNPKILNCLYVAFVSQIFKVVSDFELHCTVIIFLDQMH